MYIISIATYIQIYHIYIGIGVQSPSESMIFGSRNPPDDTELRSAMSDFRIGVSPAVEALKLGKNIERNKWLLFISGDFLFGLETFVYLR